MKIVILRPTVCDKKTVMPGDIVDTSLAVGRLLIGMGKAKPSAEQPIAKEEGKPSPVRRSRKK